MTRPSRRAGTRAGRRPPGSTQWAVDNLLAYLREQREATRHVPSDRTIVVERFRDELGDWRLVVHSPFGAQVNAPWALAIAARMRERARRRGARRRAPTTASCCGCPTPSTTPARRSCRAPRTCCSTRTRSSRSSSPRSAARRCSPSRFRECAARSLLLPRRDPTPPHAAVAAAPDGRRSCSRSRAGTSSSRWCSRRCASACRTSTTCPGLRELMADVQARAAVQVVDVATASAVAVRAQPAVRLRRDVPLRAGRAAGRAPRGGAVARLHAARRAAGLGGDPRAARRRGARRGRGAAAAHSTPERHVRDAEGTADLLRFVGDLTTAEAAARGVREEWLAELESARRAIRVRIAGEERWLAIEDAGPRARRARRRACRSACPRRSPSRWPIRWATSSLRYARTRGPFPAAAVRGPVRARDRRGRPGCSTGWSAPAGWCAASCARAPRARGGPRHRPGVLRRRGAAPAAARLAGPAARRGRAGRAARRWAGSCRRGRACRPRRRGKPARPDAPRARRGRRARRRRAARRRAAAGQRAGVAGPARPAARLHARAARRAHRGRARSPGPAAARSPAATAGSPSRPADVADLLLPEPEPDAVATPLHRRRPARALDGGGALFFRQLADRTRADAARGRRAGRAPTTPSSPRCGTSCGPGCSPTTRSRRCGRRRRRRAAAAAAHRPRRTAPARPLRPAARRAARACRRAPDRRRSAGGGRCAVAREPEPTRRAHARAEAFLERHGVLTRGALDTERVTGGFAGVYRGAAGHGGVRPGPPRLRRRGAGRGTVRGARRDRPAARAVAPGRTHGRRAARRPGVASCSRRPIRPSPCGAALDRGRRRCGGGDVGDRSTGPAARRARWSCSSTGRRRSTSSAAASRCCRSPPTARSCPPRRDALAGAVHEGWLGTLAVERADGVGRPRLRAGRGAHRGRLPRHPEGSAPARVSGRRHHQEDRA